MIGAKASEAQFSKTAGNLQGSKGYHYIWPKHGETYRQRPCDLRIILTRLRYYFSLLEYHRLYDIAVDAFRGHLVCPYCLAVPFTTPEVYRDLFLYDTCILCMYCVPAH